MSPIELLRFKKRRLSLQKKKKKGITPFEHKVSPAVTSNSMICEMVDTLSGGGWKWRYCHQDCNSWTPGSNKLNLSDSQMAASDKCLWLMDSGGVPNKAASELASGVPSLTSLLRGLDRENTNVSCTQSFRSIIVRVRSFFPDPIHQTPAINTGP